MKVKIYLKNGKEIDIECEEMKTEVNSINGNLVGYEIIGMKGRSIQFMNPKEVSAIIVE
ncbi:hypothetical protein [Clostridium baratii]|uniref:hypothetical protein n=1 Tax=Clostridium baratii TaxID=1561 RepID=UPI0030CB154B